ncbi:Linamarin synthase 2 [Glycine soja]
MSLSHEKNPRPQPHVVCVPFPAQGHINPLIQLAKALHWRGFHITFHHPRPNLAFSMRPFQMGYHHGTMMETQMASPCNFLAPFKELLIKLNTSSGAPPVSAIISDGLMTFAIQAAQDLSIPEAQFWIASACGFMGYIQFNELANRGIIPFEDDESITDSELDMPIDWIPGMKNIRLKDMPSFIRTTDLKETLFDFMGSLAKNCLTSSAIIVNTIQEFELEVLDAIKAKFPNIYNIGPAPLLTRHAPEDKVLSIGSSLWVEDSKCLESLDKWQPNSVVYVNYGSWTVITEHHLKEIALGFANSMHPFLWIIRPDVMMGESAILPKEFFYEIKERGYITNWCPQERVLAHSSIGLFLTHCGWNSLTEAICEGKPMICWPFFAEQQMNCRYACTTWGIGMELNHGVKRGEIVELVKEMIEGDKAKEMKQNVLEWRKKALEATDIGGSSYNDFNRFVKEALHFEE